MSGLALIASVLVAFAARMSCNCRRWLSRSSPVVISASNALPVLENLRSDITSNLHLSIALSLAACPDCAQVRVTRLRAISSLAWRPLDCKGSATVSGNVTDGNADGGG
eukprot:1157951-Amphidinium_carterae.1